MLPGSLSSGFAYPSQKLYVFTYSRVYTSTVKRRNKNYKAKDTIHSLDELHKGDYIVHSVHGIGVFEGVTQLQNGKIVKDSISSLKEA